MLKRHAFFMSEALKDAQEACEEDEVPVGAVIVHKDKIIARGHNQVELLKGPYFGSQLSKFKVVE
jgi:tRNA(adenine34) deaminase